MVERDSVPSSAAGVVERETVFFDRERGSAAGVVERETVFDPERESERTRGERERKRGNED